MNAIELRGVRTHNLKNLDINIPYRSLTVVTGVSGSGKSSLAFDTLYAEGQRRYVESISAYARQFLERMEKPDIESIRGILPSIAIEAKNVVTNARSTVGTQTELSDYLRLLFARIGKTICKKCGKAVNIDSPDSIARGLIKLKSSEEAQIGFLVRSSGKAKKLSKSILEEYARQGFIKAEIGAREYDLNEDELPKSFQSAVVMIDKLEVALENKSRIVESLETSFRYGRGSAIIRIGTKDFSYSNRFACAACGIDYKLPTPNLFSFNSPLGACPECQGFGRIITIDWDLVIPNEGKSLGEGAIEPWTKPSTKWEFRQLKEFCKRGKISLETPFRDLSDDERKIILEGEKGSDFFSVKDFFAYLEKKTYKMHVRILLSKYRGYQICPKCRGTRLKEEALFVKVNESTVADLTRMSISDLRKKFEDLILSHQDSEISAPILLEIKKRLRFLDEVGLGYLTFDRASRTLSGGEAQRINLATSLGSALVDTLYVLDEPSIGLHERDNELLIRLLHELRNLGNSVVIVEHDRAMIEAADWVIDLGPLGGEKGGEMMYAGSFRDLLKSPSSLTAKYFRKELVLSRELLHNGKEKKAIRVIEATHHNLKQVSVDIPLHELVVITGVSGSGKSTLLYDVLFSNFERFMGRPVSDIGAVRKIEGFSDVKDILLIDQSPIGRTPRSNPATYLKAFDEIRKAFSNTREAKSRNLSPGYFSFNVPGGRCEHCEGGGLLKVEMHFLADVYVTCDVCNGKRYQASALGIKLHGKNIYEVLQMTIDEALAHFTDEEAIVKRLDILSKMGLSYLKLGQPATTLSGGEAQRLKIAAEITQNTSENILYLFDEPSTGLHYRDISYLLSAFDRLLEKGHSVCVIEHNMEIIKCADHVIDLGPEGGVQGGRVLYEGSVSGLIKHPASYTGKYLKRYLSLIQ